MNAKFRIHELESACRGRRHGCDLRSPRLAQYSRARLQRWISAGAILLDGRVVRPRELLAGGERVRVQASFRSRPAIEDERSGCASPTKDEALLVIDKPAAWWCIRARAIRGTRCRTRCWRTIGRWPGARAGLIHRLDKDTAPADRGAYARDPRATGPHAAGTQDARGYLALSLGRPTAGAHR